MKVTGFRELERMLLDLEGPQATRALRAAMLKATAPIIEDAKRRAPARSGALRESIRSWFMVDGKGEFLGISLPGMGGRFRVRIGPALRNPAAVTLHNLAYQRRRRGIFYGHFFEFGARNVRKRAFLVPALEGKSSQAIEVFKTTLGAALMRLVKRKK